MPPPIPVQILPYCDDWPRQAEQEIARLTEALGPALIAVHHIGSTAVPGLAAKPILDLMPAVSDLKHLDAAAPELERLGYCSWGELSIPGRRYFTRDSEAGVRLVQLHCFEQGSPHIERHLAFRDYLRAHPRLAADYQNEKLRCAALHPSDSHAYSDCKSVWVMRTESKAAEWYRTITQS